MYHHMGFIMALTSLSPSPSPSSTSSSSSAFDTHPCLTHFISIISLAAEVYSFRRAETELMALPGNSISISRSVSDIGWIPPLYYTALKCGVHRVRLHAVRLLESSSHREGICDAKIAACVARKVMELEEEGERELGFEDGFDLFCVPDMGKLELELGLWSEERLNRICDLRVVLPDGSLDSVGLSYRQRGEGGKWRVVELEYRLSEECWVDIGRKK
jgi:hypothetical protein